MRAILKQLASRKTLIGLVVLAMLAWGGFELIIRSEWFEEKLRQRLVAELEEATGGEVELADLDFDPSAMIIDLRELTIRAAGGSEPFVELPRSSVGLTIRSFLSLAIQLDSLVLQQPTVRLTIADDGSTNWPDRDPERSSAGLLELGIGRLQIAEGRFVFNGVPHETDLLAEAFGVEAVLDFEGCYSVNLAARSVDAQVDDWAAESGADAQLRLCGDQVEIVGAELTTSTYGLWQVSGTAGELSAPVLDLEVEFETPLEALAGTFADGWSLSGAVSGAAAVEGPLGDVTYVGSLEAPVIVLEGPAASETARLAGDFEGGLDRAELNGVVVEIAEGMISGVAELSNLRTEPAMTASGQIEQVRLGQLLRMAMPRFVWATHTSGPFEAAASAVDGVVYSSSVTFADPGDSTRPGMTGGADFTLRSQSPVVELRSLEARAQGLDLYADGTWSQDGATQLSYDVRIATQSDLDTLFAALGGAEEAPAMLAGPARIRGQVSGGRGFSDWRSLDIRTSVVTGPLQIGEQNLVGLAFDARLLSGELTVNDGTVEHAAGALGFGGTAELGDWADYMSWPLSVQARGSDLDFDQIAALAGLDGDARGSLELSAELSGTLEDPSGTAEFALTNWAFAGNTFDTASGAARYAGGRVEVSSLRIQRGGALIAGDASYDAARGVFAADFNGAGIGLAETPAIGGGEAELGGSLTFDLTANGTLRGEGIGSGFESLTANGAWQVQELSFGGVDLGEWSGTATTAGESLELALIGAPLGGAVEGAATILADTLAYSADVEFANLAVGPLLAESNGEQRGPSGEASGVARFTGNFGQLSESTGAGSFTDLRLEITDLLGAQKGFVLYNPFPMRWTFADGSLALDHMRLQGEGTNVELTGAVGLAPDVDSDLRVEGDFNLAALQEFRDDLIASGRSTVGIRLTGDLSDPAVEGEWSIRDGELQPADAPIGLSGMNGAVLFAGREFRVDEMRAVAGGGALNVSGGGRIAAEDYEFRLDAQAESVRVRYPEGITSVVDGDFILSGAGTQRLLSGEVTINRLSTARNATLGTLLSALRRKTPTAAETAPSDSVQLNVHVASASGVEINTSLIRNVAASIDLRVVGTTGNPSLLGQIDVAQGQMNFHGSRYTINRGEIEFRNPVRVEPLLDFELETRMRGVDIALILAGPARRLNVSYRSDPPLSFSDLVNLVAVGRDPTTNPLSASRQRVEQQSLFQTGANNVLADAVQRPVSPGLQRFFGVSRLKVDPAVGGAEANPAARISTEQQLTDDVTLIYTFDLSSSQQQTLRLEWTPDRRWTFVLTRDEYGLVGSDAIYKLRRP